MTARAWTSVVVAISMLASCSGDGDSASSSTGSVTSPSVTDVPTTTEPSTIGASTTPSTTASTSATTTAPTTTPIEPGALVGQWQAETSEVLATLTGPFGTGGPTCTGPYLLNFAADGAFSASLDAVCVVDVIEAVGTATATGTYRDDGSSFQVMDVVAEGSMSMGGVEVPLPILDGFTAAFGLPAAYTIVGDVLRFSFTSPDGIDYTLEFERVG